MERSIVQNSKPVVPSAEEIFCGWKHPATKLGDSINGIVEQLKFADILPLSEGYLSALMDARDSINELIAVSIHELLK